MSLQEYAVEFLFDDKSEAKLLDLYKKLERSGFGLPEQVINFQPHITLNVCTILDLAKLEFVLTEFCTKQACFDLTLSHLGCFLKPQPIVFLAPTVTQALFALHAELLRQLQPCIAATRSYYEPNEWVPHCTVAFGFEEQKLTEIMGLCTHFSLPLTIKLKSIAVVAVANGQTLFNLPLSKDTKTVKL